MKEYKNKIKKILIKGKNGLVKAKLHYILIKNKYLHDLELWQVLVPHIF